MKAYDQIRDQIAGMGIGDVLKIDTKAHPITRNFICNTNRKLNVSTRGVSVPSLHQLVLVRVR